VTCGILGDLLAQNIPTSSNDFVVELSSRNQPRTSV
jgi:hypothetical protein